MSRVRWGARLDQLDRWQITHTNTHTHEATLPQSIAQHPQTHPQNHCSVERTLFFFGCLSTIETHARLHKKTLPETETDVTELMAWPTAAPTIYMRSRRVVDPPPPPPPSQRLGGKRARTSISAERTSAAHNGKEAHGETATATARTHEQKKRTHGACVCGMHVMIGRRRRPTNDERLGAAASGIYLHFGCVCDAL